VDIPGDAPQPLPDPDDVSDLASPEPAPVQATPTSAVPSTRWSESGPFPETQNRRPLLPVLFGVLPAVAVLILVWAAREVRR